MKLRLKLIGLILLASNCFSQSVKVSKEINGTYYLLEAERGVKTKIFEFGEHNGTKLLLVASCKKCIPAVYKYQESDSKEVGVPIFYNSIGLFMFAFDEDSFIMVMPSNKSEGDWTNFSFSNFYSKDKSKVNSMTKEKIKKYIKQLSEL
ncbi:hypothetical protein ACOSP6_07030 [Tenacibaculum sp. MEBiC06402]|uniref:hypothetical protein n=1 Tax=unclassified Tenacibaculum TaxID=2635139 RepID=UPI003B9C25A0